LASSDNRIARSTEVERLAQPQILTSIEQIISRIEQERRDLKPRNHMFCFKENQFLRVQHAIDQIVDSDQGLPNGRGRRSRLNSSRAKQLKLELIVAAGFAANLVTRGQLKNRISGRGRPPDNATFLFIDDLMQACQTVGLKPGLRYVSDSQSLPVRVYIALAPILGFGNPKNPRRLFQRWQRYSKGLVRSEPVGLADPHLFCFEAPHKRRKT
jgi:hypothetical protein